MGVFVDESSDRWWTIESIKRVNRVNHLYPVASIILQETERDANFFGPNIANF